MNKFRLYSCVYLIYFFINYVSCYPEQGKWHFDMSMNQSIVLTKSLYRGGKFQVKISCESSSGSYDTNTNLDVTWYIRRAACWKEYWETDEPVNFAPIRIFDELEREQKKKINETSYYITDSEVHPCDGTTFYLPRTKNELMSQSDIAAAKKQEDARALMKMEEEASNYGANPDDLNEDKKRDTSDVKTAGGGSKTGTSPIISKGVATSDDVLYIAQADGIYQFFLGTKVSGFVGNPNASYSIKVDVEIYSDYGYLSAADYPLLIFYSTMCVVYVIYGVGWLVVSFMRWRELLRVQYWIGAVILLGMLEKAVFTAEYESVNKRGVSIPGLIVFAELVSCAKRTLSRMLIIIVSFGFGIVKPRLGIILHRVVGVGFLYFVLASIEGCMRALRPKVPNDEYAKRLLFTIVPLALLESAICWWVFSALVSTTRTLRLRRNTIKLNLFRHFTNTLVFAVVTSVIFMLWSIRYQNYDVCLSDWKQLWVNDAFWHVLFALILLVIMILWRPTNNNQRFAFSPLLDEGSEGEEEEQEKLMANVSDTMKLRNSRTSSSNSPRESRSVEDDLKWLEENIPSSITDTGLPVMDSDEEILTTKFEISKMQ